MASIIRDAYLAISDYDVSLQSSFQRYAGLRYHRLRRPEKAAATGKDHRPPGFSRFLNCYRGHTASTAPRSRPGTHRGFNFVAATKEIRRRAGDPAPRASMLRDLGWGGLRARPAAFCSVSRCLMARHSRPVGGVPRWLAARQSRRNRCGSAGAELAAWQQSRDR